MPKKAPHGRAAKSKARPRRPVQRPAGAQPLVSDPVETEGIGVSAPMGVSVATATAPARPAQTVAARRPAARAPRTVPLIQMNYAFLRHDLRLLGLLAPAMIVVLVIAYFVLH